MLLCIHRVDVSVQIIIILLWCHNDGQQSEGFRINADGHLNILVYVGRITESESRRLFSTVFSD